MTFVVNERSPARSVDESGSSPDVGHALGARRTPLTIESFGLAGTESGPGDLRCPCASCPVGAGDFDDFHGKHCTKPIWRRGRRCLTRRHAEEVHG